MRKRAQWFAVVALSCVTLGWVGCGTSGSAPVEYPEVRFQISGATTFKVLSLTTGGATHPSIIGQEYTVNGVFSFVVENSAPPYQGAFMRTGAGEISVTLSVISETSETEVSDATLGDKDMATVIIDEGVATPTPPLTPPLEVRFNICAPSDDESACFVGGDSGVLGVGVNGNVGDAFTTHLLSPPCSVSSVGPCSQAPSILFLEGARDSINAVFSRSPVTGDLLLVQMLINGQLQQTQAGSGDLVFQRDL